MRRGRARAVDPDDDGDDDPPLPPVVRIGSRDRVPIALTLVIVAFMVIAVVKPWPAALPVFGTAPTPPPATDAPSPSATPDPLADLRRQCEDPLGWRVYTIEEWSEGTVRVWRSLEPSVGATGPLDPTIPILPLGPVIDAVGYCSPWAGPERPPAGSVMTAWSIPMPGGATPVERLGLAPAPAAPNPPSVLGGLFAPPSSSGSPAGSAIPVRSVKSRAPLAPPDGTVRGTAALRWPAGRYVFDLSGPEWSRWWSVEVAATT